MRRLVQGLLPLVLAALPCTAQAQYMTPNYYYPQPMPTYAPSYPYGWQGAPAAYYRPYQQPAYYYQPQAYYARPSYPVNPVSYPARPVQRVVPAAAPAAVMPAGDPVEDEGGSATQRQAEPVRPPKTPAGTPDRAIGKVLPAPVVESTPVEDDVVHAEDGTCPKKARFLGFVDGLYWNVHNSNVPFAQAFDGVDPFLSVPRGPVGVVSPDYRYGYRVGFGGAVSDHGWLVGTFTYFEDLADARIDAPQGDVLHSNLIFPNTINAAFTPLTATAEYNVRLLTGDLDYKHDICNTDCFHLNWLAGARYGRITQDLSAEYQEVLGSETVRSRINFDGIGPRAGFEGEYKVRGGLFGYGKGVLDLLAGRFGGSFVQRDVFGGLIAETEINEKRLVPVTEFELGAGWASPKGRIRVSGGYSVNAWFNTLTTPALIRGIQANDFTTNGNNFRDTMTFDGLVGRIEFRY